MVVQGERFERPSLPGIAIEAQARHVSTRAWAMLPSTLLHRESPTHGYFGTHSRPPTRMYSCHADSCQHGRTTVTEVTELPTQHSMKILTASHSGISSR